MNFAEHIKVADIAEPTRQCLVCGRKENSAADIVHTDKAWLCEDCKMALQKIVSLVN